MSGLAAARCLNHEAREAVSRCKSCGKYFCRECVTIFEGRMMCAACVRSVSGQQRDATRTGLGVSGAALAVAGLFSTWFVFYAAAWMILQFRERVSVP